MAHKHRLLVVDDDPLNTQTLGEIFTLKGYETHTASSGYEALGMLKKTVFCCVLSDIKMEGMNGVQLLRAARAIQPEMIFILMTAYTDDELMMEGIREGALVTLAKPMDINRLLAHLAQILNHHTSMQP